MKTVRAIRVHFDFVPEHLFCIFSVCSNLLVIIICGHYQFLVGEKVGKKRRHRESFRALATIIFFTRGRKTSWSNPDQTRPVDPQRLKTHSNETCPNINLTILGLLCRSFCCLFEQDFIISNVERREWIRPRWNFLPGRKRSAMRERERSIRRRKDRKKKVLPNCRFWLPKREKNSFSYVQCQSQLFTLYSTFTSFSLNWMVKYSNLEIFFLIAFFGATLVLMRFDSCGNEMCCDLSQNFSSWT